ncbi:MAG: SLBB domain-containing protein [Lacibacter sp.]
MQYSLKATLLFLCLLLTINLAAQIPSDLSQFKSSQISDIQLQQYVQQAQANGLTEDQLLLEFQKRGMPETEVQLLLTRIKNLSGSVTGSTSGNLAAEIKSPGKRTLKGEQTIFQPLEIKSRVFGADLFAGADPLFVPNLKMATPRNYVLGPEDELQLDIYGYNISSQKLVVSPDGFVNIKYAGLINLSGLTIEQATGVIKSRLTKYYPTLSSGDTKIQLTLGSIRTIQVTIVGAVKKPGTISLPSLATLFNALYACGGPLDNGSFRNIELIRNNKVIVVADLYKFIQTGDQSSNIAIKDNDVIRIPYTANQVVLEGGLNKVGIFEIKPGETLNKVMEYAGGFQRNAYKGRITGTRITAIERKVIDIPENTFSVFMLENGDSLYVDTVINRYQNRIIITGSVIKPGTYSLEPGMGIKQLIEKAYGLREDAFTGRATISRKRTDLTKEIISINLKEVLSGTENFFLQKEDSLHIVSVLELKDKFTVTINGPVKNPGQYLFEDSLTLQSVILQAGGFLDYATATGIEVGRRKKDINVTEKGTATTEIFSLALTKDMSKLGTDFYLQPYDVISIKSDPAKVKQINVKISGEIMYEGVYTLAYPDERLSSVIKRAGGTLPYANLNGAKLIRKKIDIDTSNIKRLLLFSNKKTTTTDSAFTYQDNDLKNEQVFVALDLKKIIANPGTVDDITLKDGDELVVPRLDNTVTIDGQVLSPVKVQYDPGMRFTNYISAAGGYTKNALKRGAFVVYPNGRAARTTNFLGLKFRPKVQPGSSIYVPVKPEGKGFDAAKAGILVSALSAIMTGLILIFK